MAEYVLLLVVTTGGQWLDRARVAITGDPVLMWGGVAALVFVLGWILKPNR